MKTRGKIPPPVFNLGDPAIYIGPLRPNAYGRWPKRGPCRILATPLDPGNRTGLGFAITFDARPSRDSVFEAFLSELLPVPSGDWASA